MIAHGGDKANSSRSIFKAVIFSGTAAARHPNRRQLANLSVPLVYYFRSRHKAPFGPGYGGA
ncbi:MAG: hypothetical protein PHY77_06310, partial [Desulfotomaculaceae bacterium]|nr:hypothetical protein [Desulfotomaculaceae bacterium]